MTVFNPVDGSSLGTVNERFAFSFEVNITPDEFMTIDNITAECTNYDAIEIGLDIQIIFDANSGTVTFSGPVDLSDFDPDILQYLPQNSNIISSANNFEDIPDGFREIIYFDSTDTSSVDLELVITVTEDPGTIITIGNFTITLTYDYSDGKNELLNKIAQASGAKLIS